MTPPQFGKVTLLAAALLLARVDRVPAQGTELSGLLAIDPRVEWTGEQVVVTMTVLVHNETDRPLTSATVSIIAHDAPADLAGELPQEVIVARFPATHLQPSASARLRARFVVPFSEWVLWTDRQGPPLWLSYLDENAQVVSTPIALGQASDIPEDAVNESGDGGGQ